VRPVALADYPPPPEGAVPISDGMWRVTGGAFPSNAYICTSSVAGEALIIDPGLDPLKIDRAALDLGLTPRQVYCTHGHFDHLGGASYFQHTYGAEVFLHPADLKVMKSSNFLLMVLKLDQRIVLPDITEVNPAEPRIGGQLVNYLPVPGHTPGSCFIRIGEDIFTGDSLYAQGVGLSDLPGENHSLLRQSLTGIWDQIPADARIHPGHGPSARFKTIRANNRALLDFLGKTAP